MSRQRFQWDDVKNDYLIKYWNTMALYKLAAQLHTTSENLVNKAGELGLKEYKCNRWTDNEELKLKELSTQCYYKDIAKIMGKTELAIYKKAEKLGIKLILEEIIWDEEKEKYIVDNLYKISIRQMAKKININPYQILKKLSQLGIEYDSNRWSEDEIRILKEMADKCHYTEITKVIDRTVGAIGAKAFDLGITLITTKTKFSEADKKYLIDNWGKIAAVDIARKLNCAYGFLNVQIKKLNLPALGQNIKWTDKNIEKLEKLSKSKNATELAKIFNTTNSAISTIANRKGIILIDSKINWTDEQNEELKILAETMTVDEIVKIVNRPSSSIRTQARRLEINLIVNNTRKAKNWTKDEIAKLEELLPNHSTIEISQILNKTEDAVYVKAKKLGLTVIVNRKKWTKEEEEILSDLWGTYSIDYIAKKLSRSASSITNRVFKLGLGSVIANNYDGLTIQEICDLFNKDRNIVSVTWEALGLKFIEKKISKTSSYKIVPITDLLKFLEIHQNIWDSRTLENNILGKEPKWLLEKRKQDYLMGKEKIKKINVAKQQLIAEKKYYLEDVTTDMKIDETQLEKQKKKKLVNGSE
jgi:hypothetical protein